MPFIEKKLRHTQKRREIKILRNSFTSSNGEKNIRLQNSQKIKDRAFFVFLGNRRVSQSITTFFYLSMNEPELTQRVKLRIREKIMIWQVLLAKKM